MKLLPQVRTAESVMREIVEGLEDGSVTLSGDEERPADRSDRFWHLSLVVAALWALGLGAVFAFGFPR